MKTKPSDRRSLRTRRLLQKSLSDLIVEKRYDAITVGTITDRADVGRSTFYAHFHDKEDLLIAAYTEVLEFLASRPVPPGASNDAVGSGFPSLALFRHFRDARPVLTALVRGGQVDALRRATEEWSGRIFERKRTPRADLPSALAARHFAGTLMTLVLWWLENGMTETPERLDEIFRRLVRPALGAGR